MKQLALCGLVSLLTLVAPTDARAQTLERRGQGDVFLDHRLDRLIRTGQYVLVQADTTIAAGDTVRSTLLVLDARLFLEGTVTGDLVGVDAELFLRPGSRVEGDVVNAGGGLYRSELSFSRRRPIDKRNLPYTVQRRGDRIIVVSRDYTPPLDLDGFSGFHIPEYNRVDGFAPDWGFTYRFRSFGPAITPGVRGLIGYRTDRGDLAGGGSAFLERGRWLAEAGWNRSTASNDRWIRSDWRNSADFLIDGDDMRNYYEADVAFAEVRHRFGADATPRTVDLGLRFEQEEARSLRTGSPWTAFGPDTLRANPPVEPGTIRSLIPFARAEWHTPRTATEARARVEFADFDLPGQALVDCIPDTPCVAADGTFTRLRLDSEFGMNALLDHTLEIELQFMLPLGGDEPLPHQRWGMLGGSGTIRTIADAAFYGDHLAYSEVEYIIPFRRLRLPLLGIPELQLIHLAGRAWTGERDGDFVQNVGARFQVWAFFARWLIDPASGNDELTIGLSWPFDGAEYSWQE